VKTYREAGGDVLKLLERLKQDRYPDLVEAAATIEVLACFGGLKLRGWPAHALVKVNSHEQRVAGLSDARIVLNGDSWEEQSDGEKEAILEHELYHLEVLREPGGAVKTDDCHRPRLKLKPHDFEVCGFYAIIERHKTAAKEMQALAHLAAKVQRELFA
jgi:hypothetical protein